MHIEKFNKTQTFKNQIHLFERDKVKSNNDINLELSQNNVIYKKFDLQRFNDRLEEIYIYGKNGGHKNDIIYSFGIVINKPLDCLVDDETFYDAIYDILKNMFGEQNIISAIVHNDEEIKRVDNTSIIRSHMHCEVIPVVYDKKKNREKLCAKELLNKSFFKNFHDVIESELLSRGIIAKMHDETNKTEYIKSMHEFKKQRLKKECELIEQEYIEIYNEANSKLEQLENINNSLDDEIKQKDLEGQIETLQKYKNIVMTYFLKLEEILSKEDNEVDFIFGVRSCFEYLKRLLIDSDLIHKNQEKNINR